MPLRAAERYLGGLGGSRTLLLGCTHYPLLRPVLAKTMPGAAIVDSASALALDLARRRGDVRVAGKPEMRYFVTDSPGRLERMGRLFLGRDPGPVELIDV